jgi:hypothetical protein
MITALMMEAVRTSETSAYPSETTRRYILEGSNLHSRSRENLNLQETTYSILLDPEHEFRKYEHDIKAKTTA